MASLGWKGLNNSSQLKMFREIILPIFRSTRLCVTACGIMHPQSSAPEDGQNNCPKHVELIGIINKPLLLHLVGCLHYLCYSINCLVFITEIESVYSAVRTGSLNKAVCASSLKD